MLTDVLGVRLLVLMGDPIPLPPPFEAMLTLTTAEVVQQDDGDGFQLTFIIAKDQLLDFSLLRSGALGLFSRVVVGVLMGATPSVLINGVITHHQLEPSHQPGQSTLTITGRDMSVMMDLEDRNDSYKNTPDWLIASKVVKRYAKFGVVPPLGPPTPDVPFELIRIPQQAETDLQFLHRLARRNGFVFHINPVSPGISRAVFAPEIRFPSLSSALTMDSITGDNVTALHFTHDGLAPVKADTSFLEPISKKVIPIPSPPSLRLPFLAAKPTPARRVVNPRNSAQETPTGALARAAAVVNNAPESVTGTGELDTVRYGSVLQARQLVGVRGVGLSYDGFYYLRQVTHHIEVGEESSYTQSFVMTREGTTSISPVVVP